jgi:hypothetical protein
MNEKEFKWLNAEQIIDIIQTKPLEEVKEFLKSYPKHATYDEVTLLVVCLFLLAEMYKKVT